MLLVPYESSVTLNDPFQRYQTATLQASLASKNPRLSTLFSPLVLHQKSISLSLAESASIHQATHYPCTYKSSPFSLASYKNIQTLYTLHSTDSWNLRDNEASAEESRTLSSPLVHRSPHGSRQTPCACTVIPLDP